MRRSLMRALDRASAETWQVIVAAALCLLFPALVALALWPAGRGAVGLLLLKGFCVLWLVVLVAHSLLVLVQKRLRVDLHSHPDAFVISNILVSGILMTGWTAFAALAARGAGTDAGLWLAAGLYLVGFLSGVVASQVLGSFYSGHIYKFACLMLACAGFPAFAAWPAAARAVFGRFFDLF
jgi:hypothetical protein